MLKAFAEILILEFPVNNNYHRKFKKKNLVEIP